jgi:hypothetical protein
MAAFQRDGLEHAVGLTGNLLWLFRIEQCS